MTCFWRMGISTSKMHAFGPMGLRELTAEKFIPNPFTGRGRMYRTGDLVREDADGNRVAWVVDLRDPNEVPDGGEGGEGEEPGEGEGEVRVGRRHRTHPLEHLDDGRRVALRP